MQNLIILGNLKAKNHSNNKDRGPDIPSKAALPLVFQPSQFYSVLSDIEDEILNWCQL